MRGRYGGIRWLAGMAFVAALIAVVLFGGQVGRSAVAQAAQTPTATVEETPELLTTPSPTEEVTPEVTRTPVVTPTETVEPGLPETGQEVVTSRRMIVVGEGRVQASPDIATANVGVTAVESSVVSATQMVSETMAAVLEALVAEGVAPEDIQTTSYSINLIDGIFGPPVANGEDQPPRYQVNNSVQVTIRDISAIGTTLDAAVGAGANQVFGVSFDVSNREELMRSALEEAVLNAEERAQFLADLTGTRLGQIVSVSQAISPQPFFAATEAGIGAGGAGPGPISPGQLEITTQVQVTYELQ